jgi:predicted DNA-binding ribbon-helix-helix protein
MKIQIENLRAQMRGVQLNGYQRALALDEYYKLLDYVEELEKLTIPAVMESVCSCSKGKGIDHDEDGKAYCIDCGKYLEQTIP